MKLEQLIRKLLLNNETVCNTLTKYAKQPAIFFGDAPDNMQNGWEKGKSYPRISFNYDTVANKERKSQGTLYVTVYCENNGSVFPEDLEPIIREELKDVLFNPDDFSVMAVAWRKTESFSVKETSKTNAQYKDNTILGCDITFDIMEFPVQLSTDPDPVQATNILLGELFPEAVVLHHNVIAECEKATSERPIFYVRLAGATEDTSSSTFTVRWLTCNLFVHVLCPDSDVRIKYVSAIANELALREEVILLDSSPMFIRELEYGYSADYLVDGQIRVGARYGILRRTRLNRAVEDVVISGR